MIRVLSLILAFLAATVVATAADPKLVLQNDGVVCVQASDVENDFASQLEGLLTNKVSGLVLDLRFAGGNGAVSPKEITQALKTPVIVLLNVQTREAAARLAMALRSESRAILIGPTNVVGKLAPDITVSSTDEQDEQFQKNPYLVLQKPEPLVSTNALLPFIDHTTEADLVRRRVKDGDDEAAEAPRSSPEQPVIHDPALARALDLYKALAVLGKTRG